RLDRVGHGVDALAERTSRFLAELQLLRRHWYSFLRRVSIGGLFYKCALVGCAPGRADLLDDRENVGLSQDEQLIVLELELGSGILRVQNALANFQFDVESRAVI